jgi:hypothetical protein
MTSETPDKRKARTEPARTEYEAFVQSLNLLSVRFAKASVRAPRIFVADPARRLVSSTANTATYLNFAGGFLATLDFQFRGSWQDEPDSGVTAEAEVEVLYSSPVPMTAAMFQLFKNRHLGGHTWPYLREFLHSSLSRTGWPVHTLPMFRPPAIAADPGSLAGGSGGLTG